MQPGIKHLVICDKVMEYDYACNRWYHWSPLMTPQSLKVWGGNQSSASSAMVVNVTVTR